MMVSTVYNEPPEDVARNKKRLEDPEKIVEISPVVENQKYKCFLGEFETKIYWGNLSILIIFHLYAFSGFYFFWNNSHIRTYALLVLYGYIGAMGVTAGVHRLWSHRTYKAKLPLKVILLASYSIIGPNTVLEWVKDHRVHHKYSDTDADPHNIKRGFWFAHLGWFCMKKHPEVIRKGKSIDFSDITSDPVVRFHIRYWMWFWLVFAFLIPITVPVYTASLSLLESIWFSVFRLIFFLHGISSINSFAHMGSKKPFNKKILPADNMFVASLGVGEGWHNYHHTFPWDYRSPEMAGFHLTALFLNAFAKIGWAYDLKTASPKLVEQVKSTKGDGAPY